MSTVVIPAEVRAKETAAGVTKLQHMPCRIEHRGTAKVEEFFTPLVREVSPGVLEGQFRGRPLDGSTVSLPSGYRAVVVREEPQSEGTRYVATEAFSGFTSWNWDRKSSASDPTARLLDWFDLADAVGDLGSMKLHSTKDAED
ncbi:Ribonuclease H2 subunit C [Amphibalanus amphitrite]|uniref:Ribonuclease H2 subunit C n=1 Tax=Amphibalanus amphitrite TaxID=1232801 RepID=A0A6A4V751_AMPAM|nr:Ribonuclease H2 subunit C [Amphibalanus amphitrite]